METSPDDFSSVANREKVKRILSIPRKKTIYGLFYTDDDKKVSIPSTTEANYHINLKRLKNIGISFTILTQLRNIPKDFNDSQVQFLNRADKDPLASH